MSLAKDKFNISLQEVRCRRALSIDAGARGREFDRSSLD